VDIIFPSLIRPSMPNANGELPALGAPALIARRGFSCSYGLLTFEREAHLKTD
jgi:hypothetical protein